MKVMHVETGMHLYGGAQQVVYLLEHLKNMQVQNSLVCCSGSEIAKAAGQFCENVRLLPDRGGLGIGLLRSLTEMIRSDSPDLIHIHSRRLGMDFLGGIAAKSTGVAAIVSRRVDNPEQPWVAKLKYKPYRKVITISEGIRKVMLAQGMSAEKVITVRSAVNSGIYQQSCQRAAFLKEFDLSENSLTIAVIAQLIHRKGHRHLLAVLPEIMERFPNLNVLFFGKGALHDALGDSIQAQQLKSVKLVGFRKDLAKWLACIDLVVHPADMEGLGVSLLQAAAAAVPVIATRAGGMPEIVRHNDNGILIDPGDTAALKLALDKLLSDSPLRKTMGKRGQEIVAEEFSTKVMAEGNLGIYRQILGSDY